MLIVYRIIMMVEVGHHLMNLKSYEVIRENVKRQRSDPMIERVSISFVLTLHSLTLKSSYLHLDHLRSVSRLYSAVPPSSQLSSSLSDSSRGILSSPVPSDPLHASSYPTHIRRTLLPLPLPAQTLQTPSSSFSTLRPRLGSSLKSFSKRTRSLGMLRLEL